MEAKGERSQGGSHQWCLVQFRSLVKFDVCPQNLAETVADFRQEGNFSKTLRAEQVWESEAC